MGEGVPPFYIQKMQEFCKHGYFNCDVCKSKKQGCYQTKRTKKMDESIQLDLFDDGFKGDDINGD